MSVGVIEEEEEGEGGSECGSEERRKGQRMEGGELKARNVE